ncbi:retrovirus-related pol polyprotein LINE-1, partial [Tanacetum coccineum]
MGSYKAPGPDRFQAIFFQRYWDTVQESFCEAALKILRCQEIPDGLNQTFLVLIPKLTILRKILPYMISPTQGAFVPGRQITDNVVIVQEVLHLMRKKQGQKGSMAIKFDLAKAYDRLRWDFNRDNLFEMKIPS